MKQNKGFTLIELVMVIVILGVVAAVAIPKFANLGRDTRIASIKGLEAAIREALDVSRAKCAVTSGCSISLTSGTTYVTLQDGTSIRVWNGSPDGGDLDNGIHKAINYDGFSLSVAGGSTDSIFTIADAPTPTQCRVVYVNPASGPTTISSVITGC